MATREENIKKINEEFEKLSDEQLEVVAGGSNGQTARDSKYLYERGLVDDWHSEWTTMWHWGSYSKAVDEGWSKAGITCVTNFVEGNKYTLKKTNQSLTRDQALAHLKLNYKIIRTI